MRIKIFASILLISLIGLLSSCEPTYPAKSLTASLAKIAKEESNLIITPRIVGKTLWIFVPLTNLVDEKTMGWNKEGIESLNKAMNIVHRVMLSTDAKINFVAIIAADVKKYGIEFLIIEYMPDLQQAVLEKFSRGEFFMRSVREIDVDTNILGDMRGDNLKYYDMTFEQFLSLQIIHRTKNLFVKDKQLASLFEIKTTSWSEKFGVLKIEFEFMKKKYDLTVAEEKIKPLDTVKMIAALVIKNYDYKAVQGIELTDNFTKETIKLSSEELKKLKIKLPEFVD